MRRMFGWMVMAALVMPVAANAVDTEDFHVDEAQDLVDVCTTPQTDPLYEAAMGFCHGYCVGAWQYYSATGRKFVCLPEKVPSRQEAINGFIDWAGRHAQYMQEGAVQVLFKYMASTYPCEKE